MSVYNLRSRFRIYPDVSKVDLLHFALKRPPQENSKIIKNLVSKKNLSASFELLNQLKTEKHQTMSVVMNGFVDKKIGFHAIKLSKLSTLFKYFVMIFGKFSYSIK